MATFNGNGNNDIALKILRFATGKPLRILDLFAGCGGLSLGFNKAGYEIVGGIEIDPKAILTHSNNFFKKATSEVRLSHSLPIDITQVTPQEYLKKYLKADSPDNLIDVIAGGPPCQAFARIGRAKLRAIMKDPQAYLQDERANLYTNFLEYVEYFHPLAVLIENVPDILNYGGKNVAEEIASSLDELGYICRYTLLNAANYGVPQFRVRFFLLAFLKDLNVTPEFPDPTHHANMPQGYSHNEAVALKLIINDQMTLFGETRFTKAPQAGTGLPYAVGAKEALEDLPIITSHLIGMEKHRGIVRDFKKFSPYRETKELSHYACDMRAWPGFPALDDGVCDHVIRYLPRDYEIFRRMDYDDEYPAAHRIAERIFFEKLTAFEEKTGQRILEDSAEYAKLKKETVPPYNPEKFANKWWKINPKNPIRTLTAHIGKDTYSHIHYDSDQARVISVREAARLQSFPDGFQFVGPMNSAFRQIGNSVPPLIAFALATKIKDLLQAAFINNIHEASLEKNNGM